MQLGQKGSIFKAGAQESMDVEKISIKVIPSTLHQDNRKDALRRSQEMAIPHLSHSKLKGVKA